jgi:hypothetical protein
VPIGTSLYSIIKYTGTNATEEHNWHLLQPWLRILAPPRLCDTIEMGTLYWRRGKPDIYLPLSFAYLYNFPITRFHYGTDRDLPYCGGVIITGLSSDIDLPLPSEHAEALSDVHVHQLNSSTYCSYQSYHLCESEKPTRTRWCHMWEPLPAIDAMYESSQVPGKDIALQWGSNHVSLRHDRMPYQECHTTHRGAKFMWSLAIRLCATPHQENHAAVCGQVYLRKLPLVLRDPASEDSCGSI